MTKVDIISGFLGAGKTTLIKKLIAESLNGHKIMLIENEFGEIGIDGGFLNNSGIEITEMNSGCICCSLVGDFGSALKEAIEKYAPERIIIEPSGVGKLSDVIKAVVNVKKEEADIELNSFTAVVDCIKCKMYMNNFGEFFNDQIESASTIILSRTQKLNDSKLQEVVDSIKEHNEKATIITTPWDDLTGDVILKAMEAHESLEKELLKETEEHHHHDHDEECECGHHHHHDHNEECECGHHHHDHDEECECGHHHHHDHDEEYECGHHHHDHDEECGCGHHHHDHDEECGCGHDHHGHHHADDVFTSWGIETPKKFSHEEIEKILKTLSENDAYGMILRAKGIIPNANGGWINFDLVPGEYEIREGKPDYTGKLCVIGSKLKKDEIAKLFGIA